MLKRHVSMSHLVPINYLSVSGSSIACFASAAIHIRGWWIIRAFLLSCFSVPRLFLWIMQVKDTFCKCARTRQQCQWPGAIGCFRSFNIKHLRPGDPIIIRSRPVFQRRSPTDLLSWAKTTLWLFLWLRSQSNPLDQSGPAPGPPCKSLAAHFQTWDSEFSSRASCFRPPGPGTWYTSSHWPHPYALLRALWVPEWSTAWWNLTSYFWLDVDVIPFGEQLFSKIHFQLPVSGRGEEAKPAYGLVLGFSQTLWNLMVSGLWWPLKILMAVAMLSATCLSIWLWRQ